MSHASLEIINTGDKNAWKHTNRLSLSGTSDKAIPKYLEMHPFIKELVFCLDNDEPGIEAANKLMKKYASDGFTAGIEYPIGKDFNDDLLIVTAQKRAEKRTLKRHYERGI
jgi:DNA primase